MIHRDKKLSRNIWLHEIVCKCGCDFGWHPADMDPETIRGVQFIRDLVNANHPRRANEIPVIIKSGCRCPEHNRNERGVKNSQHLKCCACDIRMPRIGYAELFEAAKKFPNFFYGGIGVYRSGWIHVDTRGYTARWSGS